MEKIHLFTDDRIFLSTKIKTRHFLYQFVDNFFFLFLLTTSLLTMIGQQLQSINKK